MTGGESAVSVFSGMGYLFGDEPSDKYIDNREDERDYSHEYVQCWQCGGEGVYGHECGEDTCCCRYPHENVVCDVCGGKGYWKRGT